MLLHPGVLRMILEGFSVALTKRQARIIDAVDINDTVDVLTNIIKLMRQNLAITAGKHIRGGYPIDQVKFFAAKELSLGKPGEGIVLMHDGSALFFHDKRMYYTDTFEITKGAAALLGVPEQLIDAARKNCILLNQE
jgi:hypothetical protein